MRFVNQLKMIVALPVLLAVLVAVICTIVRCIFTVVDVLDPILAVRVILLAILGLVILIPFFPTFAVLGVLSGVAFLAGKYGSSLNAIILLVLIGAWGMGNAMLFVQRRKKLTGRSREDMTLLSFWREQVVMCTYVLAYGAPGALGCLAVYGGYRMLSHL